MKNCVCAAHENTTQPSGGPASSGLIVEQDPNDDEAGSVSRCTIQIPSNMLAWPASRAFIGARGCSC